MAVHNVDIADMFDRMAGLLDIEGANPFRVRAYRQAAGTIRDLPESLAAMVADGDDLSELPAIGDDLAEKICEIVETGRFRELEATEKRIPATLADLTRIPGIGPKRARKLHDALGIASLDDLASAAKAGKVRELEGFGEAVEAQFLEAIEAHRSKKQRFRISIAEDYAKGLEAYLKTARGVARVIVAGSYRRRRETVGDLDILATAADGAAVIDHFTRYDEIEDVVSKGSTRSTVRLKSGLQVDLRVVAEESYGAALQYFTGSKAHTVALRKIARAKGLKINEYGIYRGRKHLGGRKEEDLYGALGLAPVPPELRENRGEIEAARGGHLPELVTLDDIRGDLHAHTTASDGTSSLKEMAEAAKAMGYDYLAITDHSQHATVANGLDEKRLAAQLDEIDRLNDGMEGIRILKSCEVDILTDGTLDLPDSILKRLDLTVCSVHYHFDLASKAQTERILRAMDNRHFNILGHPTGRLVGEREPYPLDLDRIIEAAKERGCFLEVNAHPIRLDLDDVHCRAAKELGVKVSIATDAHSTTGLSVMRFGVDQARRGWLEKADVLNTHPWTKLEKMLAR
ncbi:DNA polymerase/3'-5' exonuclease PolX [Kaustia mangrovi]|uniref:DNA polymerase beta n=1 Tax=Kaustia mangrovi TaxID=2593653 RepID=A0A7S8C319_9HYPH|nr:DNA polymerase/3'-5' exonuclease PolX [Kaustia mangrovi]QPC42459.1 DNA polymerase/3'-5' exonuclease PolX [Kaustia mangrovi]